MYVPIVNRKIIKLQKIYVSILIRQMSNVQNDQITGEVSAIYFIYEYILFRLPPTLVNTYHHFFFSFYI